MYKYDVIVIGAGPSGSTATKILRDQGYDVLLIDRKRFPRIKPCCGFLTPDVFTNIQKIYGKIPDNLFCRNKNIEFLWTSSGSNYNKVKGYEPFFNVYRDKLDEWMVKSSKCCFFDECEAISLRQSGALYTVTCKKSNDILEFKSNVIICAAGANSRFRRIYDPSYKAKHVGKSIQKVFEGNFSAEKNNYCVSVNKRFTDIAFSYFYFKDSLTFIGSAWIGRYDGYYENWFSFLNKKFDLNLKMIRDERCCVEHSYGENKPFYGFDNVLFIGESAGLMGEWGVGIPIAVLSGEFAAKAIIEQKSRCVSDDYTDIIKNRIGTQRAHRTQIG